MDTQTLVQQIKQKQEELKKKTLKIAHPSHKREQSIQEMGISPQQQKSAQSNSYTQNMIQEPFLLYQASPPPQQNRTKNYTPHQQRTKQEQLNNNNTPSPILFRTPHVSLHQNYLNNSNLRYQFENSRLDLLEITDSKTNQIERLRQNQQSQYKSSRGQPYVNLMAQTQGNQELLQEIHDYQLVLDEVLKKYRNLQQELNQKNRELQRTEFYKQELLKEKARNAHLRDRNQMLKAKLLKLIEVVQAHQLEEREQQNDLENNKRTHQEQHMVLAVQNQVMRRALCLDVNLPENFKEEVNDDELVIQDNENEEENQKEYELNKEDNTDTLLNLLLTELKQIKEENKRKQSQNNMFNPLSLTMTVMNKQAMVDLEEERLLKNNENKEDNKQE